MTAEWARQLAPGAFAQTFAVRITPGTTIDELGDDYSTVTATVPQKGLVNLRRIEVLPWVLAVAVGVLAIGAMVHAFTSGIRRATTAAGDAARPRIHDGDSCAAACAGTPWWSPCARRRWACRSA